MTFIAVDGEFHLSLVGGRYYWVRPHIAPAREFKTPHKAQKYVDLRNWPFGNTARVIPLDSPRRKV